MAHFFKKLPLLLLGQLLENVGSLNYNIWSHCKQSITKRQNDLFVCLISQTLIFGVKRPSKAATIFSLATFRREINIFS